MGKTTKDVQKIKLYFTEKYKIINYTEGTGAEKGTVIWIVECPNNKNRSFKVRPKGTREQKKEWFQNANKYIGKYLNVQYFEKNNDGCVVRLKTGEMI